MTVVLMNTLHHVPLDKMDQALAETARVLKAHGALIVIEPLAEGSFFAALRVVEDETAVRRAAQAGFAQAIAQGRFKLKSTFCLFEARNFRQPGPVLCTHHCGRSGTGRGCAQ
jgi:ubiquinone/menaquinone biosynthesis C-methylase UbiE